MWLKRLKVMDFQQVRKIFIGNSVKSKEGRRRRKRRSKSV
jgi:hypothetical protein